MYVNDAHTNITQQKTTHSCFRSSTGRRSGHTPLRRCPLRVPKHFTPGRVRYKVFRSQHRISRYSSSALGATGPTDHKNDSLASSLYSLRQPLMLKITGGNVVMSPEFKILSPQLVVLKRAATGIKGLS
jgi:hypothetical protein